MNFKNVQNRVFGAGISYFALEFLKKQIIPKLPAKEAPYIVAGAGAILPELFKIKNPMLQSIINDLGDNITFVGLSGAIPQLMNGQTGDGGNVLKIDPNTGKPIAGITTEQANEISHYIAGLSNIDASLEVKNYIAGYMDSVNKYLGIACPPVVMLSDNETLVNGLGQEVAIDANGIPYVVKNQNGTTYAQVCGF